MSQPLLLRTLRHRRFRLLFAAVTVSRVGDAMTFIVVSWLALGIGGARAVGFVVLTGGVFAPLSSPVLGLLIDRLGLRLLMAVDNFGFGAAVPSYGDRAERRGAGPAAAGSARRRERPHVE